MQPWRNFSLGDNLLAAEWRDCELTRSRAGCNQRFV
jgi:hypothetical protein